MPVHTGKPSPSNPPEPKPEPHHTHHTPPWCVSQPRFGGADRDDKDYTGARMACITCKVRICGWTKCLTEHINFCRGNIKDAKFVLADNQGRKKKQAARGVVTAKRTKAIKKLHKKNHLDAVERKKRKRLEAEREDEEND